MPKSDRLLGGEAQLVMSGGGTCNVLESDTRYEEKQANQGAPMDIWRLDFRVRNGSGRWLDHLIARFQIESEWPECTNWDGPDAGSFPQNIEWADSIGTIQESGQSVVAPDQTLTETRYFIVLRGDPEPRFSNWSMDFDFAANPPPAGTPSPAATAADRPSPIAGQESLFWQSILDSTNPLDFEAYLEQFPNGVFRALAENRLAVLREGPEGTPSLDRLRVGSTVDSGDLDFGDNASPWAEDGECDDSRFEGPGMGLTDSEEDVGHDATDCSGLFEAGRISLRNVDVDFGDDTSRWAADGECDDPRFEGRGMGLTDGEEDVGHDATDCSELFEAGRISLRNIDAVAPSTNPAAAGGQTHLLVWSAEPSDEHARIHIYIDGEWQVNRDVWYTWDGPPPDCNYRDTYPDGVANFANLYLESGQYRLRAAATRRGGFSYDDHGFGPDIIFAVEETIDLQPGCNVFEIVRP